MKLYEKVQVEDVLEKVISLSRLCEKSMIVVQGETDLSSVQPNDAYFQVLEELMQKKIKIIRYYFGSFESCLQEHQKNPNIEYLYCGEMDKYQRAVIVDMKYSMAKIGDDFVFSMHPLWIQMLAEYLSQCANKKLL